MSISLDKEKLLSEFAMDNFSTRRTGLEFLNHFENLGIIKPYLFEDRWELLIKGVEYDFPEKTYEKGLK